MIYTKIRQCLIIVALLLCTTLLTAQGNYVVTQANAAQVALDIAHHYPDPVDLPINEINDFLETVVSTAPPCTYSCVTPAMNVVSSNSDYIELSWSPNSSVAYYEIYFLNLVTGNISSETTTDDQITVNGMPDDFYAVSLSAITVEGATQVIGPSNIIILEKPALLAWPFEYGGECGCERYVLLSEEVSQSDEGVNIQFDPVAGTKYLLYASGSDGIATSIFFTANYMDEEQIGYDVHCIYNINIPASSDSDNTLWGPSDMTFHKFSLKVDPVSHDWLAKGIQNCTMDLASIYYCQEERIGRITPQEQNLMQLYPNPSQGEITIKQDVGIAPVALRISNAFGQVIYSNLQFTGKASLSTQHWPAGIYIATIELDGQNVKQSFTVTK